MVFTAGIQLYALYSVKHYQQLYLAAYVRVLNTSLKQILSHMYMNRRTHFVLEQNVYVYGRQGFKRTTQTSMHTLENTPLLFYVSIIIIITFCVCHTYSYKLGNGTLAQTSLHMIKKNDKLLLKRFNHLFQAKKVYCNIYIYATNYS